MIPQPDLVNLVISSGEPAGVGPEVSVAAAITFLSEQASAHITLIGDPAICTLPTVNEAVFIRLRIEPV